MAGYNQTKSYGNNSYSNNRQAVPEFKAKFIGKGFRETNGKLRIDLLSDEAKNIADQISGGLSSSQLRAIYGEVKALQNRITDEADSFDDVLPFVLMLKSKAEYRYRNGSNNKIPKNFKDFIMSSVDEVKRAGTQQAFEDFCLLFEAVVGFVYGINGGK